MSKRSQKRNITNKFDVSLNFPLPDDPETNRSTNCESDSSQRKASRKAFQCLGYCEISSDEDYNSKNDTTQSVDIDSSGASSWSDEFEDFENANVLYDKLEQINSALYGEYDGDDVDEELREWAYNFPYLRIIGKGIEVPPVEEIEASDLASYEEIIAEHKDENYKEETDVAFMKAKEKVKKAVIEKVINRVCQKYDQRKIISSKIYGKRIYRNTSGQCSKSLLPVRKQNLFNVTPEDVPGRRSKTELYQNPIVRSHLSASKWQKLENENSHPPLPNIKTKVPYDSEKCKKNALGDCAETKSKEPPILRKSALRKPADGKGTERKISGNSKTVTLPPIKNLSLDSQ